MDRIYLDYNATSPLAPSVTGWLAKGDLFWANPAAQHSLGKKSRARLDEVSDFLLRTFHLQSRSHSLVFHSGATEGINAWIMGLAYKHERLLLAFSPLDHAAVRAQRERLEKMGHEIMMLPVDSQGDLRLEEAIQLISRSSAAVKVINWTWVHNELGVVWKLADAVRLKDATGAIVHVDAVQAPGKVADWDKLPEALDAYTFSGHKFGSLKGVGFSFQSLSVRPLPLLLGGGQQDGLRSGTENTMGAWSMMLALQDLQRTFSPTRQAEFIAELREHMDKCLEGKGKRIARHARELNLNTMLIVLQQLPSDMAMPLFDLAGLEVSAGAACASGAAKPSAILLGIGEQKLARHGLRLSTGWDLERSRVDQLKLRIGQVLNNIKP